VRDPQHITRDGSLSHDTRETSDNGRGAFHSIGLD
jgi:hypothetical protein